MNSTTGTSGAPTQKRSLLVNRNYGLLWFGQAISITGDMLFTTTLMIWVYTGLALHQSWGPLAVSGVLLGASAPTLLVGPFAGVLVDRSDKRRLMLGMDALRAVVIALMIFLSGAISLPYVTIGRLPTFWTLGVIYAAVLLVNTAEQFFRPSMMALIQDIVPEDRQAHAIGMGQASMSLAMVLGPAIAAPLFVAFGPMWALLINAVSFAVSYLTIWAMRVPPRQAPAGEQARQSFSRELWEGVRFYFSNRVLVTLLVAIVVAVSGVSALNVLDVAFNMQNLHASTVVYGFIGAALGLGSIVGSIVIGMVAERIGLARTLWISMASMGIGVVILSRMTAVGPAIGLFLALGFGQGALNVSGSGLMMRETPNAMMGRVMSIFQPGMNLAMLVATAAVGYLASVTLRTFHATWEGMTFTAVDTIWLAGGVLMTLAGLVVLFGLWGADQRMRAKPADLAAPEIDAEPAAEVVAS